MGLESEGQRAKKWGQFAGKIIDLQANEVFITNEIGNIVILGLV